MCTAFALFRNVRFRALAFTLLVLSLATPVFSRQTDTTGASGFDWQAKRLALNEYFHGETLTAARSWNPQEEETKKETAVNWRARRIVLNRQFGADIQELANWCRKNGTSKEQVTETFKVYRDYGLDRQYIFLPTEKTMPVARQKGIGAQWLSKLNEIKVAHGVRLFELAKEAADANAFAIAFQLLHEVIYVDRDHEEVRRILGHKKLKDGTWRLHAERVKPPRVSSRGHDIVAWPAKGFKTVNTTHFQIDSNASDEETAELARNLESWHYVWRQVYFEYWAKAPIIKKWLNGKGGLKIPRRRFRVVFFRDHADYVKMVSPLQRGVENTAGFYNGNVSFFPATDAKGQRDDATWRHELTHQLFRQSIATRSNPFEKHFLWLDEGIAMHFESLVIEGQIATLGGFDAGRLQYSRIRRLREGYHVPTSELAGMSMQDFQARPDIQMLYAESNGIAHMLMDSRSYNMQPVLVKFMKTIHKQKVSPKAFATLIGRTYDQLDADYLEFLRVSNRDVEKRIENTRTVAALSVPDANLGDGAFDVLGTCANLRWLDLTGSKFTKIRALKMSRLDLIGELYLNACILEPGSLKRLGQLASLRELDLSNSSVDDSLLDELQKIPDLQALHISNTAITDAGLLKIARIPTLKVLYLTTDSISQTGITNFKRLRSDVKVEKQR